MNNNVVPIFSGSHMSCTANHPRDWPCSICKPSEPSEVAAARRLSRYVQDAYMGGFDKGLEAGKKIGRQKVFATFYATSVVWLTLFGLAMVWLP